ncbi:MAG: hypothetical protein KDA88_06405 [Planctomycetaceae bacterium]|nr:hypothetical protein [Planctomycetaceae bacterium]MCB9950068.1 hypothetical protein [Planctomycetaceae bacterium]
MLKQSAKLEKLKIVAYKSAGRSSRDVVGTFEAMFNPSSFKRSLGISYGKGQGYNSSGKQADYARSDPSDLNIQLILDGTNVGQSRPGSTGKSVVQRINQFLDLTYRMNGSIHEPNYLVVEWGDLFFSCRLKNVDISYTKFDRDGAALRAELDVTFISDESVKKRIRKENKGSPDVSHRRTVVAGDTLPLLTAEIYGSPEHYLFVAQANQLDNFRQLTPGQHLYFPPLEN